jgi:hypothetical protein
MWKNRTLAGTLIISGCAVVAFIAALLLYTIPDENSSLPGAGGEPSVTTSPGTENSGTNSGGSTREPAQSSP